MRFFKPTDAFWQWADGSLGRAVIELGCGRGHLLRELREKGKGVIGIDPYPLMFGWDIPFDLISCYLAGTAFDFENLITPEFDVLVCRPCHDGFVADFLDAAFPSILYYVGLEKNIERDLYEHLPRVEMVASDVGEDGECIWKIAPA